MDVSDQNLPRRTSVDPKGRFVCAGFLMDQSLCLQDIYQLLPDGMPAADEWLGDDNLKIGLDLKKALQANFISKKVIR